MQGMILVFSDLTPGQLSEVGFFFTHFAVMETEVQRG